VEIHANLIGSQSISNHFDAHDTQPPHLSGLPVFIAQKPKMHIVAGGLNNGRSDRPVVADFELNRIAMSFRYVCQLNKTLIPAITILRYLILT
jgi:hypothetical protein